MLRISKTLTLSSMYNVKQIHLQPILLQNASNKIRERPTKLTDEIIRVDHAGELGADRIYAGQLAILGNGPMGKTITHMWEQEKEHRKQFEQLIQDHRVRPTVMVPIWNVAGFVLGAGK